MAKKKKNKIYGPVFAIIIVIAIISILSLIFSIFNIEGYKIVIANNTLESQLITVKNIISIDGIKYLFENIVNNFMNFKPLVLFIIFLLGLGICEQSGLMYAIIFPLKKIPFYYFFLFFLKQKSLPLLDKILFVLPCQPPKSAAMYPPDPTVLFPDKFFYISRHHTY